MAKRGSDDLKKLAALQASQVHLHTILHARPQLTAPHRLRSPR